ncbi:MAG: flavodoxin family protein [Promethearchaeota archaeon]
MKILITYFSNTGNTEKVAYSIKAGMESHDIDLLKVKDTDPNSLKEYDLVVLGSGIYAGKISKEIVDLVKNAEVLPQKFAFFCTHASPNLYQKGWKMVRKRIKDENLMVIGEFDCYGEQLGIPIEMRMSMLEKLPPDEQEKAKKHMDALKEHPNAEDLENARNFGKSLVN